MAKRRKKSDIESEPDLQTEPDPMDAKPDDVGHPAVEGDDAEPTPSERHRGREPHDPPRPDKNKGRYETETAPVDSVDGRRAYADVLAILQGGGDPNTLIARVGKRCTDALAKK